MELTLHVEQVAGNGFRAVAHAPALTAEAPTREEALARLRERIGQELAGAVTLREEPPLRKENPLMKFAGMYKDDPDFEEFLEAIREYRRQVDADPNR